MKYSYLSPFGAIEYEWDENMCYGISLLQSNATYPQHDDPVSVWLSAYFSKQTAPLPAISPAKTQFQNKLREALCEVEYGDLRTYGELAKTLGTAPQALGQALGANRFQILIPCHRIVKKGSLGGFHAGVVWKKALIDFESR